MTVSEYTALAETLEGLAKEAAPNYWRTVGSLIVDGEYTVASLVFADRVGEDQSAWDSVHAPTEIAQQHADAALIVALVNAVPAITAALRECAKRRAEPDEERVERVARAMIAAGNGDPEQIVYRRTGPDSFEPLGAAWELFKPKARAAIRAMEE